MAYVTLALGKFLSVVPQDLVAAHLSLQRRSRAGTVATAPAWQQVQHGGPMPVCRHRCRTEISLTSLGRTTTANGLART